MRSRSDAAWFSSLFFGAAMALVALASWAQSQDPAGGDINISVDVRRVVLYATVRDTRAGTLVGDLKQDDFIVKDNGNISVLQRRQ